MRALVAMLTGLVLWGAVALAQMPVGSFPQGAVAAGGGYTGPGDLLAMTEYWGLFAYNNTLAGNNVVDLIRASDSATCTVATFASGANKGAPDVTVGVPCAGATVTAFCNATTCTVPKIYGQNGVCNLVQATVNKQAIFDLTNTQNGWPVLRMDDSNIGLNYTPDVACWGSGAASKASFYGVGEETSSTGPYLFRSVNAALRYNAANTAQLTGSSNNLSATATDNSYHYVGGTYTCDFSSTTFLDVDGVASSNTTNGGCTYFLTSTVVIGQATATFNHFRWVEGGVVKPTLWTSGNHSSLCGNVRGRWASAGSC